MQARLFISSALLLCSISKTSFACGPDAPAQPAKVPEIAVVPAKDTNILKLNGDIAKRLFNHLDGPFVQVIKAFGIETRRGQSITCHWNKLRRTYSCEEIVKNPYSEGNNPNKTRGDLVTNFPGTQEMKQNGQWIELQLFGPQFKALYDSYGESFSPDDLGGIMKYTKKGRGLTCLLLDYLDTGDKTYACTQYLSSDGFPIGDGNDPIIGSGTHPIQTETAGEGEMP